MEIKNDVLYRYIKGKVTAEEKEQVLRWLDEDPKNHSNQLSKIYRTRTALERLVPEVFETPRHKFLKFTVGIAAVFAVMVGVWHVSDLSTKCEMAQRMTALQVPPGQRLSVVLEDGTKVWLNAGTQLEYPVLFDKNQRTVRLEGEAIFEVMPNPKRPFIVETFSASVEVLGTKFNVVADQEQEVFRTTLMEGSVKVTNLRNPSETIILKPHDVVQLIGGRFCKTETADFKDQCWTEGLILIKDIPFEELMARFERTYDVKIVIEREKMPEVKVVSGKIRISDGVESALQVLQQVTDFTYFRNEEKNVIVIR